MGVTVHCNIVAIDRSRCSGRWTNRCHVIVIIVEWYRLYGIEISWFCDACHRRGRRNNGGHNGCLTGWWHCCVEFFRCVDICAVGAAGHNRVTSWVSAMIHLGGGRWRGDGVVRRSVRLQQNHFAHEQRDTELLKSIALSHSRTVANELCFFVFWVWVSTPDDVLLSLHVRTEKAKRERMRERKREKLN